MVIATREDGGGNVSEGVADLADAERSKSIRPQLHNKGEGESEYEGEGR